MAYSQERSAQAAAYLDWQRALLEEPLPCEGQAAEVARKYHVATNETWANFKIFIIRFSLHGTWGSEIRPTYGRVADAMGVNTRTAQNLITAARELGWLVRVANAGSRGGPNGAGTAPTWRISNPYALADDDLDVPNGHAAAAHARPGNVDPWQD